MSHQHHAPYTAEINEDGEFTVTITNSDLKEAFTGGAKMLKNAQLSGAISPSETRNIRIIGPNPTDYSADQEYGSKIIRGKFEGNPTDAYLQGQDARKDLDDVLHEAAATWSTARAGAIASHEATEEAVHEGAKPAYRSVIETLEAPHTSYTDYIRSREAAQQPAAIRS